MKKLGKKGFMLTETLIVSTMLITVLLILYVQFKNVTRSFYASRITSYNVCYTKLLRKKKVYWVL